MPTVLASLFDIHLLQNGNGFWSGAFWFSETLGLPWRSVEEFDSYALVNTVERVVIQPDGVDVVMKYRQVVNG